MKEIGKVRSSASRIRSGMERPSADADVPSEAAFREWDRCLVGRTIGADLSALTLINDEPDLLDNIGLRGT